MKRFEYKIVGRGVWFFGSEQDHLNMWGYFGWELVAVEQHRYIFKRELPKVEDAKQ